MMNLFEKILHSTNKMSELDYDEEVDAEEEDEEVADEGENEEEEDDEEDEEDDDEDDGNLPFPHANFSWLLTF